MKNDAGSLLDDILYRFHKWSQGYTPVKGFNSKALVAGDFRVSRQYDSENGAIDSDIENDTMKTVDFEISEMAEPYRSAIYANARGLYVGSAVFTSPRLPADLAQRAVVIDQARGILSNRLVRSGVM